MGMDWMVLGGIAATVLSGGFFALEMRHNPAIAIGVPTGMAVLMGSLLVVIFSNPAPNAEPFEVNDSDPENLPSRLENPIPAIPTVEQPANGPVNLLARIDLNQHQLSGAWDFQDGALMTPLPGPTNVPDRMWIPVKLPETFELTMEFEHLQGTPSLNVGFPVGGQDVIVCIDGFTKTYSGLNLIDKATADRNESRRQGPFLVPNRSNTVICRVNENSVQAIVNGKMAVNWKGDVNRLSLDTRWPNGPPGCVQLGSWKTQHRITKMEVKPL